MTGQRMTPAARAVFRGGFAHAIRLGHRHLGASICCSRSSRAITRLPSSCGRTGCGRTESRSRWRGSGAAASSAALTSPRSRPSGSTSTPCASARWPASARRGWPGRAGAVEANAAARPAGLARWLPGIARTPPGAWDRGVAQGGTLHGGAFLPHSPDLGELLRGAQQAGLLEPAAPLDVPQLAVGLLSVTGGAVPTVLAALGVRPAALRAAVSGNRGAGRGVGSVMA